MDLQQITSRVAAIVEDTGSFIRSEASQFTAKDVETKSINSLVTYVDKQAETQLIERLNQVLPEAGFYTEEEITARDSREWTWIIDPLDGTTNFIHGIPFYSISVGLQHENDYVMGVVLEISRR
ncbi:MAG TPA: inositol monophosphatase family protein, partial [Saprospiraceae bacterium]|nr:inositol monophosphatase family protein [Saprospiraceae bacterium]